MHPTISRRFTLSATLSTAAALLIATAACGPLNATPPSSAAALDAGDSVSSDASAASQDVQHDAAPDPLDANHLQDSGSRDASNSACPTDLHTADGQPCDDPSLICNADGSHELCITCPEEDCTVLLCEHNEWRLYQVGGCASCPPGDTPPEPEPSRQTVTFVIENDTAENQHVVTAGWFCDAFSIAPEGGAALPLANGFDCGCECPWPGPARGERYLALEPGDAWTFTWDARHLTTYTEVQDCGSMGWDPSCVETTRGTQTTTATGVYILRIPFEAVLNPSCQEQEDGTFTCECINDCGYEAWNVPPNPAEICPSTDVAEASFILPRSGDIEVRLQLSSASWSTGP